MTTLRDEMAAPLEVPQTLTDVPTEALVEALKKRFNMEDEDAVEIAGVVAEQFAGLEEVNDDNLNPEVRSIFYTLEAKKLVSFRRTEYTIETGERRRAFFWRLRHEELESVASLRAALTEESVYDTLPKAAWSHRSAG